LYGVYVTENTVFAYGLKTILSSEDGITWTARISDLLMSFYDITSYGDNKFVAVGGVNDFGAIYTSVDNGETWTEVLHLANINARFNSVIYADNELYTVGTKNLFYKSKDGINWETVDIGYKGFMYISYKDGMFVILTDSSVLNSSEISVNNIISQLTPQSDMTFNLESGTNNVVFSDDNFSEAVVTYRQKYIGV
jgi:hypothetical protein